MHACGYNYNRDTLVTFIDVAWINAPGAESKTRDGHLHAMLPIRRAGSSALVPSAINHDTEATLPALPKVKTPHSASMYRDPWLAPAPYSAVIG